MTDFGSIHAKKNSDKKAIANKRLFTNQFGGLKWEQNEVRR
jgi:hypothetical protein